MTPNAEYWQRVRARALELGTDGCTGVADVYVDCCYEHDIACRTGADVNGQPATWAGAAWRLRRCIQERSRLGVLSPLSWWRWAGVRLYGWWARKP